MGVWCPRQAIDVPLEHCLACEDCTLVKLPCGDDDGFVVCADPDDEVGHPQASPTAPASGSGDRITVSAIMTTRVVCVAPDLGVHALERSFVDEGICSAPVVDDHGLPLGVVSGADLVRWHSRCSVPDGATAKVEDIMTPCPLCIRANVSIARAAAFMAFEDIETMPVVGARGEVVGVVTAKDVLGWFARSHGYVLGNGRRKSSRAIDS